jgi:hypothetical protein
MKPSKDLVNYQLSPTAKLPNQLTGCSAHG